jgi:RND family efflux transporter MFP subunit
MCLSKFFRLSIVIFVLLLMPVNVILGDGITAITKPSADVTLSFVQAGRIALINFREGDSVKVGDVLVQQDDAVERARLAQLEAESNDKTKIQASEFTLAQRRVDLERLEARPKAVTQTELEHAKLNLDIAELSLRVAVFQHEQAQRKYEEAKLQIERMSLKSPIDGRIEEIEIEAGESVNALDDVVRVVRVNPLWIDVPVPLSQTTNLGYGHTAVVEFPSPKKVSVEGTVIFIAAVADAGSDTLRVRIQVPNNSSRPAGEHVVVTFPTLQK